MLKEFKVGAPEYRKQRKREEKNELIKRAYTVRMKIICLTYLLGVKK